MKHIYSVFFILFLSSWSWGQCALSFSVDSIPATCAGSCDGSIIFSFTNNGTPAAPYVLVYENSSGISVGSNTFFDESGIDTLSGVCAGIFTVSIQSILEPGCFYQTTVTVTEPIAGVISSVDVTHETSGLSNAEITINASGGVMPYVYSINNGGTFQVSNQFTGLSAGTYFVVVQDANGCEVTEVVGVGLIVTSGCEIVAEATPQPTLCSGGCDGEIVYTYENLQMISGAPYSVTLEDSDGNILDVQTHMTETETILFENLCAGTYTIILQGSSCSFVITGTVLSPPAMTLYANTNAPTFEESNGTAGLVVIGGVPDYQYSVDGGGTFQLSPDFSDLAEGNYQGVVQDANGCLQQLDFTLTDITHCVVGIVANPLAAPSCYGLCDGSISYTYSDTNEHTPYSIALMKNGLNMVGTMHNSPDGTSTFSNVCAGNYEVVITDGLGCTAVSAITLAEPDLLLISDVNTTNSDPDSDNGTATINITGGQAPYVYSLNGVNFFGSSFFSNLSAGVHLAYVEDGNGCDHSFPFVIHENAGCNFNIITTTDSASCTGSCDGSISYQFSGTSSDTPFSIVLEKDGNIVQTAVNPAINVSGIFSDLCPGIYVLKIGNSTGCEQLSVAVINEPSDLNVSAITQPASTGNNDGEILVSATGGTGPYEYSIDNQVTWQSSFLFSGLGAGFYTTWVKDVNGCFGVYTVEIEDTSSCSFIVNLSVSEIACLNNCNGSIACTFIDVLDNPPFVIQLFQGTTLIDTSASFPDFSGLHQFSGLCEGGYTIAVVDADGCTDSQNVYVHGPDQVQVVATDVIDATAGNSDGSAEITVTGGTAPYEFSINSGASWQDENTFNNLAPGFYITMIEDANGCFFIHCFTINEQPGCNIITTFNLSTPISCYDSCDAVIQYGYFEAVNTPPYKVKRIANSGVMDSATYTTNNFTGTWGPDTLCQGIFSILVTNGNGCTAAMPSLIITLPPDLDLSAATTDASTGMTNGSVELTSMGGTGQYLFSIDGTNFQAAPFFENMAPGNYLTHVMDENGCSDTVNIVIGENADCNIEVTTLSDAMLTCAGDCSGAISFDYDDANNNPPYSVLLTNNSGGTTGSAVGTNSNGVGLFTNLCAGVYYVTVTDASGCQSGVSTVTIAEPPYLQVDIDAVHPTDGYYNGMFTFNPSGGTPPYEYSSNNQVTWSTNNTWSNLAEGFYIIYVRDANGCVQVICVVLSDQYQSSVIELGTDILVYPNPTQGMVFVNAQNIQMINVYDLSGQQMTLDEIVASNGIALDFSTAASGVYVLEITMLNGEILRTQVVKN